MKIEHTMDSRLFGRTWASFFHVDPGEAVLEALVTGRGSVVLKGETDIVMEQESWERFIIYHGRCSDMHDSGQLGR